MLLNHNHRARKGQVVLAALAFYFYIAKDPRFGRRFYMVFVVANNLEVIMSARQYVQPELENGRRLVQLPPTGVRVPAKTKVFSVCILFQYFGIVSMR